MTTAADKKARDVYGDYIAWLFEQIEIPTYKYQMLLWALADKPWAAFSEGYLQLIGHVRNLHSQYTEARFDPYTFKGRKDGDEAIEILRKDHYPSFLEVLVALSVQMGLNSWGSWTRVWARVLVRNLDLLQYTRNPTMEQFDEIDEKLERCIWRRYEPSGRGGFFPLRNPEMDQRRIGLWEQLNAYLDENPYGPPEELQ